MFSVCLKTTQKSAENIILQHCERSELDLFSQNTYLNFRAINQHLEHLNHRRLNFCAHVGPCFFGFSVLYFFLRFLLKSYV